MAELATAFVRVRPNLTGFKAEAEAGTRQAGAALGKLFALAFGTVVVEELARHTIVAAAQQDAQFAKIRQLTKSAGAEWEVYGKTVQEAIIEKSESSGFAVDQLATAYGRLIQQTKDSSKALQLLTTASDVARARGTAVTQVATSLSRALGGNAQALSRLGIIIPKYTAGQDAAKKKLQELAQAETALSEIRRGVAPIKLDEQARAYETLGETQRAQLKLTLQQQLAQAAALDKTVGAEKTLAEVAKRFKGQGAIFGETAAGQADRFQISVHELEVTIGEHLIPLLGSAAEQGRKWAVELEHSSSVGEAAQAVADNLAGGVRGVASAIAAAYPAIKITAEAIQAVLSTVGAGPLLATYAAYKGLVIVTGIYAAAEGRVAAARAAAATATVAETGATAAATVATSAQAAATELDADAQLALFSATELEVGAQQSLFDVTALTTVATEAQTVSIAEEGVAAAATGGELGFMGAALAAIGTGGILLGLAAVAGGIYYLSTRTSDTERAVNDLTDAFGDLNEAAKKVATTHGDVTAAGAAITSARIAREQAAQGLAAANAQLDTDYTGAHATQAKLAQDQLAIAQAADTWRRANSALLDSEKAKTAAAKASSDAIADQKQKTNELIDAQLALASADDKVRVAGRTGIIIADGAGKSAASYAAHLREVASDTEKTTAAQRFNLRTLADYTEAIGKIPSDKVIRLTLNDDAFYKKLTQVRATIASAAGALFDAFTKPSEAGPARGAAALPVEAKKKLTVDIGDATVAGVTQGLSKAEIARQVAASFRDAVVQAKQSLTSIGSTLGDQIGKVMDAALAASEAKLAASPAALRIKQLLAEVSREQAERNARSAGAAVDTTLAQLQALQRAFGPGAHTAAQDAQLTAANNAYLDAQSTIRETAAQHEADSLQKGLDNRKANLEKRNEAEKTAAARRLADLNSELDRGLISQQQYVSRLNALLRREGVNYKAAGKLLGESFAQGFQEQVTAAINQARILSGLTPAQRGRGSGAAPVITDPRKVAGKTEADLVKQNADHGQTTAKNTAETVAEIKKLGAVIEKHGNTYNFTIPPDVSKKDAAQIAKLASGLRKGAQ